jgi:hypothetical protein
MATIAKRIIDLAKQGEKNADILCERALSELGIQQLHLAASQRPQSPLRRMDRFEGKPRSWAALA